MVKYSTLADYKLQAWSQLAHTVPENWTIRSLAEPAVAHLCLGPHTPADCNYPEQTSRGCALALSLGRLIHTCCFSCLVKVQIHWLLPEAFRFSKSFLAALLYSKSPHIFTLAGVIWLSNFLFPRLYVSHYISKPCRAKALFLLFILGFPRPATVSLLNTIN